MVAEQSRSDPDRTAAVEAGGVTIDTDLFAGYFGDQALHLTAREFDLLSLLVRESHRVTSREEIRQRIWRSDARSSRVVDTYVCRLRKKLKAAGHPGIGVVQRRGYRLLSTDG